jgi:cellulose synthase/poly-beta-1,6-N-acetylglucosamine synthase-like glycosyltransferase
MVVRQEINILVKTKQAGNYPQIFPNWRLLLNNYFCLIVENLKTLFYLDNVLCSMNRPLVMQIFFGQEHLVKNWLISTIGMVIYFKGTIFQGSAKLLFTSQNWVETS